MPEVPVVLRRLPERVVVGRRHRHLQHLRLVLLRRRLHEDRLVPRDDDHPRRLLPLALVPVEQGSLRHEATAARVQQSPASWFQVSRQMVVESFTEEDFDSL